jgi:hypothetical protein
MTKWCMIQRPDIIPSYDGLHKLKITRKMIKRYNE